MNLSDLQDEIGRLLSDPNHDRWNTNILTSRINLAQTEIQGYTNSVKTVEYLTPVQGQAAYTLNSNTMNILRATKTLADGTVKPFDGITLYELDYLYPNWKQWSPGEPLKWWFDETSLQINFAPVPDAGNAVTNGITLWEIRKPTDLSSASDIPFDSTTSMIPYHLAICHWVVAQCFFDDGTPEAIAKSKVHRSGILAAPGEYERCLKQLMDQFDNTESVPSRVMFMPTGGRTGAWGPSKSYPLV